MSKSEGYKARYKARGSGRGRAAEGNVTTTVVSAADFKSNQNRIVLNAMQARLDATTDPVQRAKQVIAMGKRISKNAPAEITSALRDVNKAKPATDLGAASAKLDAAMKTARSDSDIAETRRQIYGRQQSADNRQWSQEANADENRSKAALKSAEAEYGTAVAQAKRYNRAIDANVKRLSALKAKTNKAKRVASSYVSGSGLASPRDQSAVLTNSLRASSAQFDKARRVNPAIDRLRSQRVKIGPKPNGGRAPIQYYDTRSRQRGNREFGNAGKRPGAMSSRSIRNRGNATRAARIARRGF